MPLTTKHVRSLTLLYFCSVLSLSANVSESTVPHFAIPIAEKSEKYPKVRFPCGCLDPEPRVLDGFYLRTFTFSPESVDQVYDDDIQVIAVNKHLRWDYLSYMLKHNKSSLCAHKLFCAFVHDYRAKKVIKSLLKGLSLKESLEKSYGMFYGLEKKVSGTLKEIMKMPFVFDEAIMPKMNMPLRHQISLQGRSAFKQEDVLIKFDKNKKWHSVNDSEQEEYDVVVTYEYKSLPWFDPMTVSHIKKHILDIDDSLECCRTVDIYDESGNKTACYMRYPVEEFFIKMFEVYGEQLFAQKEVKYLLNLQKTIEILDAKRRLFRAPCLGFNEVSVIKSVDTKAPGFLDAVNALPFMFPMSFEVPNAINK